MTYVSSLTYIKTGMLTTLPYYSFKSFFNTNLYLIIINGHAVCLKTFLNEGNSRYTFKQYTTTMLQLYM